MSLSFKADKRSQYSVYGFCRRLGESFMIDEIVDICVDYYHICESFDAKQNYHGMRIALDKDSNQFIEKGGDNDGEWATVLGETIIKDKEIFLWEFEVIGEPAYSDNTWKMVIGVVPSTYKKSSGPHYTFIPPNYGLICSKQLINARNRKKQINGGQTFGESEGDKLRMTLDLKQYKLSYVINGIENKNACYGRLDKAKYKLAISLCKGRKLKLVCAGYC